MEKREFKATEGLLHDVMRKQAGSVEKALLEAVMNSVDAGADNVSVSIDKDEIVITDDGKGMESDEVREYFEKFGLKDDDVEEKEFGKFRMGRGQIFNFGKNVWHSLNNVMIVDLENDSTTVEVEGEQYELDTSGLSYNLIEVDDPTQGCVISIDLYNELDDIEDTVREVRNLVRYIPWLHDISLEINGERVDSEFEYDYETDVAYYRLEDAPYGTSTHVYNKGARVNDFDVVCTKSVVVTKKDLDVNFARNDILDTCDMWETVKEELDSIVSQYLLDKDDHTDNEKKWMLNKAAEDPEYEKEIGDIELLDDVDGNPWTLSQLKGEKVSFGRKGDEIASEVMEKSGAVILDQKFSRSLDFMQEKSDVVEYTEVIDEDLKFEMSEVDDDELSKKRLKRLEVIRWVLRTLGHRGTVKAGWSKNTNVWKDADGVIYIHKNYLNTKKDVFQTEALHECVKVAAHDGDTRRGFDPDYTFLRNYYRLMKEFPEIQRSVMNGSTGVDKR